MTEKYSAFSYKNGNSFLHKMPAWIKILLLPLLSVVVFNLNIYAVSGIIVFQIILAFLLKFTIKEQYRDLKPIITFSIMLYLLGFLTYFFAKIPLISEDKTLWNVIVEVGSDCLKNTATCVMLIKLFCVIQTSSLVYKTSTSLEIREGVGKIESCIRRILHLKPKNTFTTALTLFVCFIPMVFKIWTQSKMAWQARQGKHSIKMYFLLLTMLFTVGMKNAYNTARAIVIREE